MTMNPLPPQAYTKETLLKAYQWLMVQNSSIKEMATTPDILVSLYLKAIRDGDSALERPSIKNFKNELKSLAGIMGELDRSPQPQYQHQNQQQHQQTSVAVAMPPPAPTPVTAPMVPATTQTQVSYTEKTLTAMTHNSDIYEILDSSSQDMIREVKDEFNLSSNLEALRMLVKVGYNRSKGLLK